MRRACITLTCLFVLLAACGDGGSTRSAGTTPSSSPSTTGTVERDSGFSTSQVSTPPKERGLLTTVRATADGGTERVTFEFEGALPGYRVAYVDRPVIQDGSGEEVTIDGEAVLLVHFEPASGFDLEVPEGRQVYRGPERLDLATNTVTEVVRVGDFEAVLQWAIGLSGKVPFRVRTAAEPNRIILEVQAGPE